MTAKTFFYGEFGKINPVKFKRYISIIQRLIYFLLLCCVLAGCRSTKSIIYFQPPDPYMDEVVTRAMEAYTPKIKPGDVLSILVTGLDNLDREIFNPPFTSTHYPQTGGFIVLQPIRGFTVDNSGNLEFPQIGKIKVVGMTTNELEIVLTDKLREFFKSPAVTINIANFIISILGEVNRPAQYLISNNQMTLPEVIALAGDLTIYGRRDNILVIRTKDGERTFARVDLTQRDLFESPYFYLHAGDIIYIEATQGKLTSTDRVYQLTPVLISSLSFMMLLLNTILNNVSKK